MPNIILDYAVKEGISTGHAFSSDTPLIYLLDKLSDSLEYHLNQCHLLISPAGTLCLEAGLHGKPVVVDVTNYRQVTIKLLIYGSFY